VNNSFYDNDTKNTGAGEFQIQYYSTNNLFENNIVYASSQNLFIYGYTTSSGVTADYNVYYSAGGAANSNWTWKMIAYTGFGPYRTASGQDVHSTCMSKPRHPPKIPEPIREPRLWVLSILPVTRAPRAPESISEPMSNSLKDEHSRVTRAPCSSSTRAFCFFLRKTGYVLVGIIAVS
jgi:hypothetical protein